MQTPLDIPHSVLLSPDLGRCSILNTFLSQCIICSVKNYEHMITQHMSSLRSCIGAESGISCRILQEGLECELSIDWWGNMRSCLPLSIVWLLNQRRRHDGGHQYAWRWAVTAVSHPHMVWHSLPRIVFAFCCSFLSPHFSISFAALPPPVSQQPGALW